MQGLGLKSSVVQEFGVYRVGFGVEGLEFMVQGSPKH